jgi:predicted DNA-binding protein with PD1-like motif
VGQPPGGGDAAVHMHAVVSISDAAAYAGHLGAAHVRPIVQMIIHEVGAPMRRVLNARTAFLLTRAQK